jgi:hypothetical protein
MNVGTWSDASVSLMIDHSHLFAIELDANDKSNTLVPPCAFWKVGSPVFSMVKSWSSSMPQCTSLFCPSVQISRVGYVH